MNMEGFAIEIIHTGTGMQQRADRIRQQGKTIALVPTMGFLHEGHLSLMRIGRKMANDLVVSIFVNPTQFGPGEDFDAYPRDFDRDAAHCRKEGVDAVFAPDDSELYGKGFQTFVTLEHLPHHLCGISRPIHFRGVATVVTKLFNLVKPCFAVFGLKDYQQFIVVRQMAKDLHFDTQIVGGPIIREPDGLAMSSRNTYLTDRQRISALSLYESLENAQAMVDGGEIHEKTIVEAAEALIRSRPETHVDYIEICDPDTLERVETIRKPALMALAVRVGKSRLIDNKILHP